MLVSRDATVNSSGGHPFVGSSHDTSKLVLETVVTRRFWTEPGTTNEIRQPTDSSTF